MSNRKNDLQSTESGSPKVSVIIAAYNVENYIEQALNSCVQPGSESFEFIVVDDCSTDRTSELILRFIQNEPGRDGFHLIQKKVNEGLGMARNTGIECSRGEYIMFLDGDDWFEQGFFGRILEVLGDQRPDLLVFDHARAYPDGRFVRSAAGRILEEGLVDHGKRRNSLLTVFHVAWNKVYRRSLLDATDSRFRVGLYEDVPWSWPLLITAEKVYAIHDVGIFYRQRNASITKSTGDRHFDVIAQYEVLFDALMGGRITVGEATVRHEYIETIYRQMRKQLLLVYGVGRVRGYRSRTRFLKSSLQLLQKWRASFGVGAQDKGMRLYELFGIHAFRAYLVLRSPFKKSIAYLKKSWWRSVRVSQWMVPIKKNRVFIESYWGQKADCNPLAIARGLDRVGSYDIVWCFSGSARVPADFPWRTVRRGSFRMFFEAASSALLVSNANLPGHIVKKPRAIHVQTQHGTPLKLMGIDMRPHRPNEMRWSAYVSRSRRWDLVVSSNPHSSYVWRRSAPFDYTVIECGYPRNDLFFNSSEADVQALKKKMGVPLGKKVALFAPTWRDGVASQSRVSGCSGLNLAALANALGDEYVLLLRGHYFLSGSASGAGEVIDVSEHPVSNEVALVSDMLISDYSSIMFDFACLKRPIILFQPDLEEYKKDRGLYFDTNNYPPGPILTSEAELLDCIKSRVFESDESRRLLKKFADRFAPWDDGRATDRVLSEVFGFAGSQRKALSVPV